MSLPVSPSVAHLRGGGTSVVADLRLGRLPRILHWGADLGELHEDALLALADSVQPTIGDSEVTYPQPVPVIPQLAEGWLGRPGIAGSRDGRGWAPKFEDATASVDGAALSSRATDVASGLTITIELSVTPSGLVLLEAELENTGEDGYRLDALELTLPIPGEANELLDLTGRWANERVPQRHPFPVGAWVRESRGGKPGLEHSTLLLAGEAGFRFRRGLVWGVHLGWSGNSVVAAERVPAGSRLLRAGELLHPSEVVLEPGGRYRTPVLYGSWGEGLDALAARFHAYLRARAQHPSLPRPVIVNTWESVYFDHDPAKLEALAQRSAELGAERFVIDDGWFLGRRDDRRALGDWLVDRTVWPDGLGPIAARVHELGMSFGLWFEPEMLNMDSELAREHPEWVFDAGHGPGLPSRHQHVLDLGHEDAYELVLERISSLVDELGIDFIKWDHNRYLTDAGHQPGGRPGVHRQTLQAYRMMDELRRRHPSLEIESCASGGGRIDLGVLQRSDRVWVSDTNDPHERIDQHRWTGLLLPPELLGAHIGAERAHTTQRVAPIDFRGAGSFWGNLGVELDLTALTDEEFGVLRSWVMAHREWRELVHTGEPVHADTADEVRLDGVVSTDRCRALFQFAVLDRPATWPPERLRFPGLDPDRGYVVRELAPGSPVPHGQRPPWMQSELRLPGAVLERVGIEAPSLDVDRAVLLSLTAD